MSYRTRCQSCDGPLISDPTSNSAATPGYCGLCDLTTYGVSSENSNLELWCTIHPREALMGCIEKINTLQRELSDLRAQTVHKVDVINGQIMVGVGFGSVDNPLDLEPVITQVLEQNIDRIMEKLTDGETT